MTVSITPSVPNGSIKAIASKSVAHRALICAAFADKGTRILCEEINRDIEATVLCLRALGAKITRNAPYYDVEPVSPDKVSLSASLPCGESGSTLRFLVPVVAALGADAYFVMEGRLPERPLSPLREELEAHGISFSYPEPNVLRVNGRLCGSSFSIEGNVSSQFITGLLLALSLLHRPTELTVTGRIESAPYINITTDALKLFGAYPEIKENVYRINSQGVLHSPEYLEVEGDWSNAAFPLCLGIIGKGQVTVTGLDLGSSQGDRAITDIIRRFGGRLTATPDGHGYFAANSCLKGTDIDASQIPDLVPVLAVMASVADGETRIYGAGRLRLKESDRLESVSTMLQGLGAQIRQTEDGLIICGQKSLSGGRVNSFNDHRIAMSAAVAAAVCEGEVIIDGAEATSKSYPSFFEDMSLLGIRSRKLDQ